LDFSNQTENATLAKSDVLPAITLHHAKNVMLPSFYTITPALLSALLDIPLEEALVLNATLLAKLALLTTLLNAHPALLHTNYGKEVALLNALLELTLLV
jgi:hypothetical protein